MSKQTSRVRQLNSDLDSNLVCAGGTKFTMTTSNMSVFAHFVMFYNEIMLESTPLGQSWCDWALTLPPKPGNYY